MSDIEIECSFKNLVRPWRVGEYVLLSVQVTLKKRMDLSGGFARFPGPSKGDPEYFIPTKEYLEKNSNGYRCLLTLKPYANKILSDVPSLLAIEIYGSDSKLIFTQSLAMQIGDFLGAYVKRDKESHNRNVLLFGLAGSGKSSFINTTFTALSQKIEQVAVAGGHTERVTTEYKGYRLAIQNGGTPQPLEYVLWDTWGIERDNYQNQEFERMLAGEMRNGTAMSEKIRLTTAPSYSDAEKNAIHVVLFMLPAAELDVQTSQLVEMTKGYMHTATSHGVRSLLCLTKADTIDDQGLRANPEVDWSPNTPVVRTLVNKAASKFNLPPNQVFPLVSYQLQQRKNSSLDRLVGSLLATLFNLAQSGLIQQNAVPDSLSSIIFDI